MADIDVVPKHRNYVWLWILLALIVVAVLFWAFRGNAPRTMGFRLTGGSGVIAEVATPLLLPVAA